MKQDPYGRLEKTEEQQPIKVVANPVEVALSAHKLWLPVSEQFRKGARDYLPYVNIVYDEAARLLKPYAKAFGKLDDGQLEAILSGVETEKDDWNGLFLSALLNETALQMLSGKFECNEMGYKLAAGKLLIVQPDSKIKFLGTRAAGMIVNYGSALYIGYSAVGGVQINCYARPESRLVGGMAADAQGGVHITYGSNLYLGHRSTGGLLLNCGEIDYIGKLAANVVFGNFGTVTNFGSDDGFRVNLDKRVMLGHAAGSGTLIDWGRWRKQVWHDNHKVNRSGFKRAQPLVDSLAAKLTEVAMLKDELLGGSKNYHDSKLVANVIRGCDWAGLESEIAGMAKKIEEAVK